MWDGNVYEETGKRPIFMLSENQCGMETLTEKASVALFGLSENQCGMETNRNVDIVRLFWEFSLSENQCGMETRTGHNNRLSAMQVEREPMWDGNWLS